MPSIAEVLRHASHELPDGQIFGRAMSRSGVLDTNVRSACRCLEWLYLPDANAAVASMLLQDTRGANGELRREALDERIERLITVGVKAPTQCPSVVENVLGPHLEDGVRVREHERAAFSYISKHVVEDAPIPSVDYRIHPHQQGIQLVQGIEKADGVLLGE